MVYDTIFVGPHAAAEFRHVSRYAGTLAHRGQPASFARDFRLWRDTTGTITANNRVMVKADPESPEAPMAGARVRLHRKIDGYCAWQGISDSNGYYHASGLEVGLTYIPVAIDLSGTYECVAAGPVIAVKADA